MATHLPHADWCEVCMKGRGRNSPHRRRDVEESTQDPETAGAGVGPVGSKGSRVPKVSMCCFYMYTKGGAKKAGAVALPTHEIRARLRSAGRFDRGGRQVVLKRYLN